MIYELWKGRCIDGGMDRMVEDARRKVVLLSCRSLCEQADVI